MCAVVGDENFPMGHRNRRNQNIHVADRATDRLQVRSQPAENASSRIVKLQNAKRREDPLHPGEFGISTRRSLHTHPEFGDVQSRGHQVLMKLNQATNDGLRMAPSFRPSASGQIE